MGRGGEGCTYGLRLSLSPTPPLPAAPRVCGGWGVGVWGGQGSAGADCPLVDLVLKDVEVVGGRYSDDVLMWVPRSVKDLLAEV